MEENFNSFVEKVRDWNLENIYYLIESDETVQIENLSNLERSISKENLYYTLENKPHSYKSSIIEVIKYLKENESLNKEFLKKKFEDSSQKEKLMQWKIICIIRIKDKAKKEYLLWAPYNGGLFVINNELNKLYIKNETLKKKTNRLLITSSNINFNLENFNITIFFSDKWFLRLIITLAIHICKKLTFRDTIERSIVYFHFSKFIIMTFLHN